MASIQKRPNGKYLVRWRNDENAERSKQFDLKRDANRYRAEIESSMATGSYVDPKAGNITLRQFYDEWKQRQLWTTGTARSMEFALRQAPFAKSSLNKIRRSHIESWVKQMERDYAVNTVHTRFRNIKTVLSAAAADGLIIKNPSESIRLPRKQNLVSSMRIPSPEQVSRALEGAEDWYQPYVALCAFAGLRRGEAAAIRLEDIDFLGRSVHVAQQVQKEPGLDPEIRAPKYNSDRIVYVPDQLIVMLSEHVKNIGTYTNNKYLFPGIPGWPLNPRQAEYRWQKTIDNSQLEDVTLHDLRHFFASGLIAAGCDVVTVQRAMGHKSPSVTLNTYAHLWPDAADRTRVAAGGLMTSVFNASEDHVRTEST